MTCAKCIHFADCLKDGKTRYYGENAACNNVEDLCKFFKDSSRFVELPCKVGDVFYFVISTSRFNSPIKPRICKGEIQELSMHIKNEGIVIVVELQGFSPAILGDTDNTQIRSFSRKDFVACSHSTYKEAEKALWRVNEND